MLDIKPLVFASFLIVLLSTGSTGNEIKGVNTYKRKSIYSFSNAILWSSGRN